MTQSLNQSNLSTVDGSNHLSEARSFSGIRPAFCKTRVSDVANSSTST